MPTLCTTPKPRLPETARLALVGTGAVGSELCRLLLEAAHPHVLLIDPDRIEPRNLPLSALFYRGGSALCGQPKAEWICSQARAQGLPWQAMEAEIADIGYTRLLGCDVLLSCTDSALARVETTLAARSLRLPLLDAAVQSNGIPEGRVTCFSPVSEAACYLCGLAEQRRADLLAYALSPTLGCAPAEVLQGSHMMDMTGTPAAVQSVARELLALLASCLHSLPQNSFACRLTAAETPANTLPDLAHSEWIELTPSPTCPWHSLPSPDELVSLPFDRPLSQLLPPGYAVDLPWPMCLRARCLGCLRRFSPNRRTALVRRRLPCPFCGTVGRLEPLESVHSITAGSALAPQTLQQLGLPAGHRFLLRSVMLPSGVPAS